MGIEKSMIREKENAMTLGEHHRTCSHPGCSRQGRRLDPRIRNDNGKPLRVNSGGKILCEPHYRRLIKYGNPEMGPPMVRGNPRRVSDQNCRVGWCNDNVKARGLCNKHYYQAYRLKEKTGGDIGAAVDQVIRTATRSGLPTGEEGRMSA